MSGNGTAVAVREQPVGGALAMWDREQVEVIKTLICPGATDPELKLFGQVCQKSGLDPFSRQIYGIMRSQRQQINGEWKTVEKLSIQTSIDGFRLIAERSGKYGGQLGPLWCGPDGVWQDVWLSSEYPSAAKVGVIRTDWKEPLWATARWDSYVQTYKARNSQQETVGTMWARMPDVMLAKVAESLALRRAFPAELSGLYTSEEMQQADHKAPSEDLPQFQHATVVASASAPVRNDDADNGPPVRPDDDIDARLAAASRKSTKTAQPSTPVKPSKSTANAFDRQKAEAEYTRLAEIAVRRGHKDAAKIQAKNTSDLTDDLLIGSIQVLTAWAGSLPAEEAPAHDPNELYCEACGEIVQEVRFKDGTIWAPTQLAVFGRRKHSQILCIGHYREANAAKRRAEEALQVVELP